MRCLKKEMKNKSVHGHRDGIYESIGKVRVLALVEDGRQNWNEKSFRGHGPLSRSGELFGKINICLQKQT
jgi:hypothetical protein